MKLKSGVMRKGYVVQFHEANHPRKHKGSNYVFEHILVAEHALGRHLPDGAEIHHVNENTSDNRPANLVICENHRYHDLLHCRMRSLRATGDAHGRYCYLCKQWEINPLVKMDVRSSRTEYRHRACRIIYERERRARRN